MSTNSHRINAHRTAMAASEVQYMGEPKLKYNYYGRPERIAILDHDADATKGGDTYFTSEPVETTRSRMKRDAWDRGEGTTKRKPPAQYKENSGTADAGTVAFLDFFDYRDELFIAFVNTRSDQQGNRYADTLISWVYDEAKRRGKKVVDWGKVLPAASRLFWRYFDNSPHGLETVGKPEEPRPRTAAASNWKVDYYRGVPVHINERLGVPILEAIAKGQTNVAHRLLIDAMAEGINRKARWWTTSADGDEAGRWWTTSNRYATQYAQSNVDHFSSDPNDWMVISVVMQAKVDDGDPVWNAHVEQDAQGVSWAHVPSGTPVTIVSFAADLPDSKQAQELLDGWRGITSPGNFDAPRAVMGDGYVTLNIAPMKATAAAPDPWTVLSVVDTREFIEGEGDKWYPVGGSGDLRPCDRCGKPHEIHATVKDSKGDVFVVGIGCAKIGHPELDAALKAGQSAATTLAKNKAQVDALTERLAIETKMRDEVDRMPAPPIVKDDSRSTPAANAEWLMTADGRIRQMVYAPYDRKSVEASIVSSWRNALVRERLDGIGVKGWTAGSTARKLEDALKRLKQSQQKVGYKVAASTDPVCYRGITLAVSKEVANSLLAALNSGRMKDAATIVVKWAQSDQNGFNDGTGIGVWWSKDRGQIERGYARGGNLVCQNGVWSFEDVSRPSLGVVLEAAIPEASMQDRTRTHPSEPIQLLSVSLWTASEPYSRNPSYWTNIPVSLSTVAAVKPQPTDEEISELIQQDSENAWGKLFGDLFAQVEIELKLSGMKKPRTFIVSPRTDGWFLRSWPDGWGILVSSDGKAKVLNSGNRVLVTQVERDGKPMRLPAGVLQELRTLSPLRRTAELGGRKLWWRVHPSYRDFSPESATSTPINNWLEVKPVRGFSAVGNPWHVWTYCASMGWLSEKGRSKVWHDDVIGFTGEMVTTEWLESGWQANGKRDAMGEDGEPLVVPDMKVVQTFSWDDFERELMSTPFPAGAQFGRAYEGEAAVRSGRGDWRQFAQSLLDSKDIPGNDSFNARWKDGDRVAKIANFIIDHWLGEGASMGKAASLTDRNRCVTINAGHGRAVQVLLQ